MIPHEIVQGTTITTLTFIFLLIFFFVVGGILGSIGGYIRALINKRTDE